MTELEIFNFEGREMRVEFIEGEPWWLVADVVPILCYSSPSAAARQLRPHHKGLRIVQTPGGSQSLITVNRAGIYRLLMRASPNRRGVPQEERELVRDRIERFQDWVTDEIIPTVMRTGSYSVRVTPPEPPPFSLPQTYSEALRALADEHDAREAAEAREAAALKRLSVAEPRAVAWSVLADPARDYDVGSAAAILNRDPAINTGRNRLFKWMLANGLIYEDHEHGRRRKVYKPYQKHVDAGRLVLRIGSPWTNPKTGDTEVGAPVLMITVKGLGYIQQKMGGAAVLDLSDRPEPLALPPAVQ
jgi:anti-repressor protein